MSYKSPLRYPGGKSKALSRIAPLLPSKVTEYREPMVGGGSVFFHARSVDLAARYWINDIFFELATFYEVMQDNWNAAAVMNALRSILIRGESEARKWYQSMKDGDLRERHTDDLATAIGFFVANRTSYSGTTASGGFSPNAGRFTQSAIDRLKDLPAALSGVKVTCFDFERVIEAPGKDVFMFIDPPYPTAAKLYGHNGDLHDFDHVGLCNLLQRTRHRFLLTYDDCPQIRELYKWADVSSWSLQYGMDNCGKDKAPKQGAELFIKNY